MWSVEMWNSGGEAVEGSGAGVTWRKGVTPDTRSDDG